MEKQKKNKPLLILSAAIGVNLTLGVLYSWSVISKALTSMASPWTNQEASLPYTVAIIVFAVTLLIAGVLQDKMGPKRFVVIGVLMVGTGLFLSSFATTSLLMILTYGILVGGGIGFGYSCVTPAAMKWFHRDYKGVVTGLVVAGFGIAAVYVAPVTSTLIDNFGIFSTFRILGIFVLVVGLPLSMLITNPPAGYVAPAPAVKPHEEPKAAIKGWNYNWVEMIKTPQFWFLWIMFALASSAGLMIIGNVSKIAKLQAGFDAGFVLVIVLAVFNALGRIGGGYFSDKIGRIRTLQLVIIIQAINMGLFVLYTSPLTIAIGTAAAGIAYGALLSIFPSLTSDYYGMKAFGNNYGVLYTAWGLAGAIGPVIAASVIDATGNFNQAYVISAVLLIGTLVVSFLVRPITGKKEAA